MRFQEVNSYQRGFTLVELLIVISIIAVLASMSIMSYLKYKEKSLLTSHALPIADACSKDLIAYCINLSVDTPQTIDINSIDLANCKDQNVIGYNLNITLSGSFVCNPGGTVSNGTVEATVGDISAYKAVCELNENSINCRVEEQ